MPPVLEGPESDDDMDVPDIVPAKAKTVPEPEVEKEEDEEEEGSDEDDAEDEYRVERILKHDFHADDHHVIYLIKWLGFEKKADQTWEPVENLSGAPDILAEYHEKIGGAPVYEKKGAGKRGKRGASDAFAEAPAPESEKKKTKRGVPRGASTQEDEAMDKKTLPSGQWENEITRITSVTQEDVAETNGKNNKTQKQLTAYLLWNSGHKTLHAMPLVRRKCPQKLLDYYEQHLVFNTDDDSPRSPPRTENGENGDHKTKIKAGR